MTRPAQLLIKAGSGNTTWSILTSHSEHQADRISLMDV